LKSAAGYLHCWIDSYASSSYTAVQTGVKLKWKAHAELFDAAHVNIRQPGDYISLPVSKQRILRHLKMQSISQKYAFFLFVLGGLVFMLLGFRAGIYKRTVPETIEGPPPDLVNPQAQSDTETSLATGLHFFHLI
jgi:hypothetical protein